MWIPPLIRKNEKQQQQKKNIMQEKEVFNKKALMIITQIHRKIPVLEYLSNNFKGLQVIRLANLLKRNPCTGVLEPLK